MVSMFGDPNRNRNRLEFYFFQYPSESLLRIPSSKLEYRSRYFTCVRFFYATGHVHPFIPSGCPALRKIASMSRKKSRWHNTAQPSTFCQQSRKKILVLDTVFPSIQEKSFETPPTTFHVCFPPFLPSFPRRKGIKRNKTRKKGE